VGIPTLVQEICWLIAKPRARLKSGAEWILPEWLPVGRAEIFALPGATMKLSIQQKTLKEAV
jgi:hypothetical protein